jgi:predicted nucleic acid-binding protein
MLVDTDVLVWYFRGNQNAIERLNQISSLAISSITYLELLQGVRNRAELLALQKSLNLRNAVQLPVTPEITYRAANLMEALTLSHGLQLGDALIAATALVHGMPLLTGNVKHFSSIGDLVVAKFDPTHVADQKNQ